MKKLMAALLAALTLLALAGCGEKKDNNGGAAGAPATPLELLETVWNSYTEADRFAVVGGDFSEENAVEDAPGKFSLADPDTVEATLGLPAADVSKVTDCATLSHMMNSNTFTCGVFATEDAAGVAKILEDSLMNTHWICGFPDLVRLYTLGNYVVEIYGAQELVDEFSEKLTAAYPDAVMVCDKPIA